MFKISENTRQELNFPKMTWIWQLAFLYVAIGEAHDVIRIPLYSSRQCFEFNSALKLNYFGFVYIGNPPEPYKMLFDTGSSYFWVSSKTCSPEVCLKRKRYNSSQSTTHKKIQKNFTINYLNYEVSGFLSQDSIKVAGIIMPKQTFLEATEMSHPHFIYEGYDGVVGLGMNSFGKMTSILKYMVVKGLVEQSMFSIYLKRIPNCFGDPNAGEVVLGGSDPLYYTSLMNNFAVSGKEEWKFKLNRVQDNDLVYCELNCWGLIRSAFPYTGLPKSKFNYILKKVGVSRVEKEFLFDCSKKNLFPTIQFQAPGATFTLETSDYIFKEERNGSLLCVAGLQENDHYGNHTFVLGNIFIRKYYTEFDFQNNMIGIGRAKQLKIILI